MECPSSNDLHHKSSPSSASHSLLCLHDMQQCGDLCDVTLKTNANQQVSAHRAVLAAASPYFRAMFVNNLLESTQRSVIIRDIEYDILQAVVAYAYNAEFILPKDRVLLLMIAADLLQIIPLRDECSNFLQRQLCPDNCLSLRAFAELHSCSVLFDICTKFALDHFEEVMGCDEYLYLPPEQLKDLLARDEVRVTCEEDVYSAVMRWIYHDLDARKDAIPEIMGHVRLPFVSSQFLSSSIEQESLIRDENQCQLYIQEAYTYKQSPEKRSELRYSPRVRSRKPSGISDVILTAGGMCRNHPISAVEQYDVDTNTWSALSNLETARFGLAACCHRGHLYAIGGYNDSIGYLDSVECYNVRADKWSKAAPMLEKRRYHAIHVLYGLIYAVGGQNTAGILSTVERYNPELDQWSRATNMHTERMYHGLAEMDGLLFAVGGHNGMTRLRAVEFYDPSKDTWTPACSMSVPRSVAGVASLGGSIFVAGGYNGRDYLDSVESYDIEVNKWFSCPPMSVPRSAMGLVGYEGCLYACGGFNGSFETSVEKYSLSGRTWVSCASMLVEKVHFGTAWT